MFCHSGLKAPAWTPVSGTTFGGCYMVKQMTLIGCAILVLLYLHVIDAMVLLFKEAILLSVKDL